MITNNASNDLLSVVVNIDNDVKMQINDNGNIMDHPMRAKEWQRHWEGDNCETTTKWQQTMMITID